MSKGIRLFTIAGIRISLDYTWFIVFTLFAWSLAFGYFPFHYPGFGKPTYVSMGLVSALLLFACVLIHEISHSITANRLGLDIHEITLFIFGGMAELTKEPDDPAVELKIALAGPAASGALALFFYLLSMTISFTDFPVAHAVISYLAMINAVLLIFNMIPGFPLDGGRVLRAIWWMKTGDMPRATMVASRIGRGFAMILIISGVLQIAAGNFTGGLWAVFIGFFLQNAAQSGYQDMLMKRVLKDVRVKEIMSADVVTIDEKVTVTEAVDKYFLTRHHSSFPITAHGRVIGILSLRHVRELGKDQWPATLVKDLMTRLTPEQTLSPDESALSAIGKLASGAVGRCPVLDAAGKLVGIVSKSDIIKVLEMKAQLRSRG